MLGLNALRQMKAAHITTKVIGIAATVLWLWQAPTADAGIDPDRHDMSSAGIRVDGCLTNSISCNGSTSTSSDANRKCDDYKDNASYNLVEGSFSVYASGTFTQQFSAGIQASDLYTISGTPAGAPLTFQATLVVHAVAAIGYCGSEFLFAHTHVAFGEAGGSAAITVDAPIDLYPGGACGGSVAKDTTLTVELLHAAGEPFALNYTFEASSGGYTYGYGYVTAHLALAGLPPGAQVISCQGYSQTSPTEARTRSWGALKTQYR